MGWRDELFHAISVNIEDNSREGVLVDYTAIAARILAMPPADRIALARELLAGTDRVVARELEPFTEDRKQQPFERGFDAGWNEAIDAMLEDTK